MRKGEGSEAVFRTLRLRDFIAQVYNFMINQITLTPLAQNRSYPKIKVFRGKEPPCFCEPFEESCIIS